MARVEKMPLTAGKMDVFISEESIITGDLQTKSNIRIEGQVQGNVNAAGNVHIGTNAKVNGNLTGLDLQIAGTVNGNIQAAGELMLYASAKLTGDVKAAGLTVEKGAYFKGSTAIGAESVKECARLVKPEEKPSGSK